jgi:hypothetical protein
MLGVSVQQIWIYGIILTEAGVYNHSDATTQKYCRTDQSSVLANSPWFRWTETV